MRRMQPLLSIRPKPIGASYWTLRMRGNTMTTKAQYSYRILIVAVFFLVVFLSMAQGKPQQLKYDCGPSQIAPVPGYSRLSINQIYSSERGYGLIHSPGDKERGWRKRGVQDDGKLDTFIFDSGGLTFVQDLPNGDYLVSLASGDAVYDGAASIKLNGAIVSDVMQTDPGGFVLMERHRVAVTQGQLRVEIGGKGRLNWLSIMPAAMAEAEGLRGSSDPKATIRIVNEAYKLTPDSEYAIGTDKHGEIVRINRGLIRDWLKVPGIKKYWDVRGPQDEEKAWIAVTCNFKDVDRDGRLDIFRMLVYQPYGQLARFDYDGKLVWKSEQLPPCSGDESGVPIVDLDGNGRYECMLSQWACLVCIDADSGRTKWKAPLDKGGKPGPGSWDYPMAVGHFDSRDNYAVVTRAGLKVMCFDAAGRQLWTYDLAGDTYGHELDRYDVDGDGFDEVFIGRNRNTTALDHDGTLLWQDNTQRNHTDFFAFGDIDEDGRFEVIYDHDGCGGNGPLYIADACTGDREFAVDYRVEGLAHAQALACADFRPDLPGLEFACDDKSNFIIMWDAKGSVLWKCRHPSSLLSKADWDGDGAADLLVFTVGVNVDPAFSIWNGHGKRLYAISWLPALVRSHATGCGPCLGFDGFGDIDGNGKADIPVAFGPWKFGQDQYLFLMEAP